MRWSRSAFGITAIALAAALAGCGSSDGQSSAPAGSSVATSTAAAAGALRQFAPFLTAARTLDGQLHTAATAINGSGPPWRTVPESVKNAVEAAALAPMERALPAGMPEPLVKPAILVLSDLVSRRGAMKGFTVDYLAGAELGDHEQQSFLQGLANGAVAAAHFSGDLAALETAARSAPAFTPAAPDSRSAAELAVIARDVELDNFGCDTSGGSRMTSLPTIVWQPVEMSGGGRGDGTVDTIAFSATWTNGAWSVVLDAC
jgi:hypothetical protein